MSRTLTSLSPSPASLCSGPSLDRPRSFCPPPLRATRASSFHSPRLMLHHPALLGRNRPMSNHLSNIRVTLTHLESTPAYRPTSVDSKQLTANLNPSESTPTKNRGGGPLHKSSAPRDSPLARRSIAPPCARHPGSPLPLNDSRLSGGNPAASCLPHCRTADSPVAPLNVWLG
jgi:hypothetical protein